MAKAVGERALSCWPTLTAAGTQQPGKEGLAACPPSLGHIPAFREETPRLVAGERGGSMSDGVAQWLSAQGFGDRQSCTPILPLGCSGSRLELQWYTARRTWCR